MINLILNGGFETGRLWPGWRKTPGTAVLDGGVTDTTSRQGSYCLELRSMDYVEYTYFAYARALADLKFYVKCEGFWGPALVRIEYTDGSMDTHWLTDLSTSWQLRTFPVEDKKQLSRIQFMTGETEPIYIDDVALGGVRDRPTFRHPLDWFNRMARNTMPFLPESLMMPEMMFNEAAPVEAHAPVEERLAEVENQVAHVLSMLAENGPKAKEQTKPKAADKPTARPTRSSKKGKKSKMAES